MKTRITARSRRAGFTFLEIMLVVAIIGILAGIVGPKLVGKTKDAKIKATKAQINSLKNALHMYEMDAGDFPSTSEGLQALVTRPSNFPESEWPKNGYLDGAVPKDLWGTPYQYGNPSEHGLDFDLSSAGPDRQFGTVDDITNWGDGEDAAAASTGKKR